MNLKMSLLRSVKREMKHSIQISFQGFGPRSFADWRAVMWGISAHRLFSALLLVNTANSHKMSQMDN